MVQYVERLPTQFQAFVFGEANPLAERGVEIGQAGEPQIIAPAGSAMLEQRLAHRQSPRHHIAREKRQGVQLARVAVHWRIHRLAAVVRAVRATDR